MRLLAFVLLLAVLTPLEQVQQYAAKTHQHVTVTQHSDGYWWIELSKDSEVFGVGKTVNDAAWDFLTAADMVAHETGRPELKRNNRFASKQKVKKCPKGLYCI